MFACKKQKVLGLPFHILQLSICFMVSCKRVQKIFQSKQSPSLGQLSSYVMILSRPVGEDQSQDGKPWRPAMNLAAFADSEEDISIQLQLLQMPSLGCSR